MNSTEEMRRYDNEKMEVIDLSIRKPQPVPLYTHQHPVQMTLWTPLVHQPSHYHGQNPAFFQRIHYGPPPQLPSTPTRPAVNCEPPMTSPQKPMSMNSPSPPTTPRQTEAGSPRCLIPQSRKRPFKAVTSSKSTSIDLISAFDPDFEAQYKEFRRRVISQLPQSNSTNRNMKRNVPANPEKCKDPEYIEKRKKNNEAAKKSREARKAKEDELAIKLSFLETDNLKLKFELAAARREKKMRQMRILQL